VLTAKVLDVTTQTTELASSSLKAELLGSDRPRTILSGRSMVLALGAAFLTAAFLWWLIGHRLIIVNDEGIYLDGARRILAGQVPYRDFFVLTGPAHFWNVSGLFQLFGMTLGSARVLVVLDIALLAGGMFWLAAQLAGARTAAILTFGFVGLLSQNTGVLVVNHRWDSSAASLASVILVWLGWSGRRGVFLVAAGMVSAYAAWITPSVLLVAVSMGVWILLQWTEKRLVVPFVAGMGVASGIALWALAADGAFWPMVDNLLWTARNYSEANRVPYGFVPGGYLNILHGTSAADRIVYSGILLFYALPALLPVLALGWLWRIRSEVRLVPLLWMCGAALLLSCFPRCDREHLVFVSPVFFVLAGTWLARVLPKQAAQILGGALITAATAFLLIAVGSRLQLVPLQTTRGMIEGSPKDIASLRTLLCHAPQTGHVFVDGYAPLLYFFTNATNPTRFSFLQPGMMTEQDERSVIGDLSRIPPDVVLHVSTTTDALRRIWPGSDPRRMRLAQMETWRQTRFTPACAFESRFGHIELLRATPPPASNPEVSACQCE
jgi:hypothetical protein